MKLVENYEIVWKNNDLAGSLICFFSDSAINFRITKQVNSKCNTKRIPQWWNLFSNMETIQEYLLRGKNLEKDTVAFFSFLTQIKKCFCNTGNIEVEKLWYYYSKLKFWRHLGETIKKASWTTNILSHVELSINIAKHNLTSVLWCGCVTILVFIKNKMNDL